MDTMAHWGEEETGAALKEVRKWIAWQVYVPLKQLVWHGARCCGQPCSLSNRRLDKIKTKLRSSGPVAEVRTYLLDL